mmetsp:Transcript_8764/g.21889  ORF Transcript_8764/g.21889 Transcript_8764/m.21889 type:complete len:202 (-) Transcript_8764:280-885(-)
MHINDLGRRVGNSKGHRAAHKLVLECLNMCYKCPQGEGSDGKDVESDNGASYRHEVRREVPEVLHLCVVSLDYALEDVDEGAEEVLLQVGNLPLRVAHVGKLVARVLELLEGCLSRELDATSEIVDQYKVGRGLHKPVLANGKVGAELAVVEVVTRRAGPRRVVQIPVLPLNSNRDIVHSVRRALAGSHVLRHVPTAVLRG